MPTYDYKCIDCNYSFELFQPMSAEPLETCPECKGKVKRLIGTGAGAIFKGSGFYQTDYKNTSNTKSETKKTEAPKTETKKDTTATKEN